MPLLRHSAFIALLISLSVTAAEAPRLSSDQLARAVRNDAISIPTPGELFAALGKPGKPNWSGQFRGPIPTTYRNRPQIALNLGGLIADGFIAVEAQDSQQVKNIGTDIIKMAKALGVSENILSRGNSINDFAENNEWDALQEELEATQNEVKSSMLSHQDQDLVILVSLGGWIRGTEVVSSAVLQSFNEQSAKVLRQPALVNLIHSKLKDVSSETQNDPLVKKVSDQLDVIEKLVSFPPGKAPTVDDIRKVHEAVNNVMTEIQEKSDTK
jgi:division protein CdvB (Snf7/Vps24/ESCRT-III family)